MAHDSFFGEHIVWSGRPADLTAPPTLKAAGVLFGLTSVVSGLFALAQAVALRISPVGSFLFATWCAGLGWACFYGPRLWLRRAQYIVTHQHVIWRRGPFRRTIERSSISFARVFWSRNTPGVGDLQLVRAVPTGALRRRLTLTLTGLVAPDRVWAIIRGAEAVAPRGVGSTPLAQRLDVGEKVLWSGRPSRTVRVYLPTDQREWMLMVISTFLFAVLARMIHRGVPTLERLHAAGLATTSLAFTAVAMGMALTAGMVLASAAYIAHHAVVRRAWYDSDTKYLITDRRVLIQRGREELHLDRTRVADVIEAPAVGGTRNVFLVVDGPRARALAASGAFGELRRSPHLRPVFERVADAEGASRILRAPDSGLPRAA
jgi:hypothetical protein